MKYERTDDIMSFTVKMRMIIMSWISHSLYPYTRIGMTPAASPVRDGGRASLVGVCPPANPIPLIFLMYIYGEL